MTVDFQHGKGTKIYANNIPLSTVMKDHSEDHTVEMSDVTTFGDNDRVYIPGQRTGQMSMSGFHDGSTAETDRRLRSLAGGAAVVASVGFGGDVAGTRALLINGFVSNFSVTSPAGGVVEASASIQFSSQTNSGLWLAARATRAVATTHAGVTFPGSSASTRGAIGHLHVFSKSTSTGVGIEFAPVIQDSSNGVAWADLITFASLNSTQTSGAHERVKVTGNVYEQARIRVSTQNSTAVEYASALARL